MLSMKKTKPSVALLTDDETRKGRSGGNLALEREKAGIMQLLISVDMG